MLNLARQDMVRMNKRIEQVYALFAEAKQPLKFMEVCGTHTMAAFRSGLRSLLPERLSLISGPGCPVCVTANDSINKAIAIAGCPDTIVATFGDMIKVPGSTTSLERVRAQGGHVHVVYSPLDALDLARKNPDKRVVFLGVGFETTVPGVAWTIKNSAETGVANFSVLCMHKTMPAAMAALVSAGPIDINGFLCPGHVSVVIGSNAYAFLAEKHKVPCVVAGFEPMDMVGAIEMLLRQIVEGRSSVEIEYSRSVTPEGNLAAQRIIQEVFEPCDAMWRGVGRIPGSGLKIRREYAAFDAELIFSDIAIESDDENPACICGKILRGVKTPYDCALFARQCTPSEPVGACMVSSEGTCAAYYAYAKKRGA